MRTESCVLLLCVLVAPLRPADGGEKSAPTRGAVAFRDAATHASLAAPYEKSREEDPIRQLEQSPLATAAVESLTHASLFDRSDTISGNGKTTLLPKGAILVVPESVKDRLGSLDGAELVPWPDFLRENSGWLHPLPVRLKQALGEETIDPALLVRLGKLGRVVVATYHDHPISVHTTAETATAESTPEEP